MKSYFKGKTRKTLQVDTGTLYYKQLKHNPSWTIEWIIKYIKMENNTIFKNYYM
jgi:hypothetical protein